MQTLVFTIRVRPGASRTAVGGAHGDPPALVVAVTAPAVDGRANDAVVNALAAALKVRSRQLRISSGSRSRTKMIEAVIDESDEAAVQARLAGLLGS